MPFNEVIPVYNEIIRNAYVQNAALLTVNADGTYSYHSILKGQSEYWLGAAAITMTTRFEDSTVWDSGLEFGPAKRWVFTSHRVVKLRGILTGSAVG
jgi:hypothetical protein